MQHYIYKSRYGYITAIVSAALIILFSGCSSPGWVSCLPDYKIPLKVSFERVDYDSSAHTIDIGGKIFCEYYNNIIFPAFVVVAIDMKDSLKSEGPSEYLSYSDNPLVRTASFPPIGEFEIKGKFTDNMIMYIYSPGHVSVYYDLKDLKTVEKELKHYYK